MAYWVISVSGIAILSVLCDVILPEGEMRKYIKTVFGIVVTLVIIQPIIMFVSRGASAPQADVGTDIEIQQQYLQSSDKRKETYEISNLAQIMQANGIDVIDISAEKSSGTLFVTVNENYNLVHDKLIRQIASKILPDYNINIVWK